MAVQFFLPWYLSGDIKGMVKFLFSFEGAWREHGGSHGHAARNIVPDSGKRAYDLAFDCIRSKP